MPDLTPRERDVLRLIACGYRDQQIADKLGVSAGSAHTYTRVVLSKLGVANRTQAALCALMNGTVALEEAYHEMLEAA